MATAGFHLFVSLTAVQGSQTPQLNTSCTLGREQTTFIAGIACPVSLLGAICLREPPRAQSSSPNPSQCKFTSTAVQQRFLHAAWLSLTQEQRNTFMHTSHSLTCVCSLAGLNDRLWALQESLLPTCSTLIISSMQWIGSAIKSSWKMTTRQILSVLNWSRILSPPCSPWTAQAKSSWKAKQLNVQVLPQLK